MTRFIGVSHRMKIVGKKGEPMQERPTLVCIREGKKVKTYELSTETDELDFLLGRFPASYQKVNPFKITSEEFLAIPPHHVRWKEVKNWEEIKDFPEFLIRRQEKGNSKKVWRVHQIPKGIDGLRSGDKIAFILSGSGNRLAYAGSRRAEEIGAEAYHIPGFKVHDWRLNSNKTQSDHELIANHLATDIEEFYTLGPRDRGMVSLREAYYARIQAMKARIAAEQRLRSRYIGQTFCNPEGKYPEGEIELAYVEAKANDQIYQALLAEEKASNRALGNVIADLQVYQKLFVPIPGFGPAIASRLIAGIGDIRQFPNEKKFKAFCGVAPTKDGEFARRRNGQRANWKPDCRQALYLFGDQLNRRPDSRWGKILREYKQKLRAAHPHKLLVAKEKGENGEVGETLHELKPGCFTYDAKTGYTIWMGDTKITLRGKTCYGDYHIHRMATWRTLTKFVEWLYRAWWDLVHESAEVPDDENMPQAANG